MIRLTPILLALVFGYIWFKFSAHKSNRALEQNSTLLEDGKLSKLVEQLSLTLNIPQIKVFIYEIAPINGLASNDGRIFITRGFYNKMLSGEVSPEELISVIAHELGHVALGHSKRRMVDFSTQHAIRTALAMIIGRFIPFFGGYIAMFLTSFLSSALSKKNEYDADAYASALLIKSGFGVEPQISLFKKLGYLTGANDTAMPWLASHPKTEDRVAAIRKLSRKWQTYNSIGIIEK